jgi:excisionase family DNA binding protein
MKMLSVNDVADKLGVHHSRVRVLIRQGRLKAQKIGRTWVILEKDLKKLKIFKSGRPKIKI